MRKKTSIVERLARRPGRRSRMASKAIAKPDQVVDPHITPRLNRELTVSPPSRGGAPKGNSNRLVHGKFTTKRRAFMATVRAHVQESNWLVRQVWAGRPTTKSGRRVPMPTRRIVERVA